MVDAATDNLTEDAYPVFFDQSGDGNSLMPAHDVTNNIGTVPGFYCDNAPDVCAIYVTEEQGTTGIGAGPPDSTSNTAIIPLSFAAQDAGCSSSDPVVNTESSFSMEHFIPAAVDATCQNAGGVVDINTANDTHSVVSDFASASPSAQIVFLDDPDDSTQATDLAGGSHSYAYIPIAVSATVVGMLAGDTDGDTEVGIPTFDLTPNMVAGLITSSYEVSHGYVTSGESPEIADADNIVSALGCDRLKVCASKDLTKQLYNELPYDTFDLLNPVPAGYIGPLLFDAAMSDVANGASYQTTDWLCNAPNAPITVKVDEKDPGHGGNPATVTVTDPNTAPGTPDHRPVRLRRLATAGAVALGISDLPRLLDAPVAGHQLGLRRVREPRPAGGQHSQRHLRGRLVAGLPPGSNPRPVSASWTRRMPPSSASTRPACRTPTATSSSRPRQRGGVAEQSHPSRCPSPPARPVRTR